MSRGGSVSVATGYGLDDRRVSSSPGKFKDFHFSNIQTGSGSHRAPYQRDMRGSKAIGACLTTHQKLVPRLIKHGLIHQVFHTSSWCSAELSTGTLPVLRCMCKYLCVCTI
jgi:hypothetical protein